MKFMLVIVVLILPSLFMAAVFVLLFDAIMFIKMYLPFCRFLQEGALLFRIRWYGDKRGTIYFERKTHHEKWILDSSVKVSKMWKPSCPFSLAPLSFFFCIS
jgi:SPX domain protein involved in polyphosphate accumulation